MQRIFKINTYAYVQFGDISIFNLKNSNTRSLENKIHASTEKINICLERKTSFLRADFINSLRAFSKLISY